MYCAKGKHEITKEKASDNKFFKIIALCIGTMLLLLLTFKVILSSHSQKLEYAKPQVVESSLELISPKDPLLQKIKSFAPIHPKAYAILKNPSEYPKDLLVLASKKPETVDFVADFVNHKGGKTDILSSVISSDKKGKYPLYMQWDERWGYDKYGPDYFAINGCGPTALSMVTVGLTGNEKFTPQYIKNFSASHGYLVEGVGTAWSLMTDGARKFGIRSKVISLSEQSIIKNLKKGHPIIATMGPGHFTTQGHYIVLTGINDDGKIIVNDSDSKERSNKTWDIDILLKEAKNVWAFSL